MGSRVPWARNLSKHQLGGVVFGCTSQTINECHAKQLFGLPAVHFLYVKNIEPGLPLFMFNYTDRKLHGVYEAASSGKMNIDPYAWTADGAGKTQYPAQVQIIVRLQCQALVEAQFKPILADNYYKPTHFWFELDHVQANSLTRSLYCSAIAPRSITQKAPPNWKPKFSHAKKREEMIKNPEPQLAPADNSVRTSSVSSDGDNNGTVDNDEKDVIYRMLKELALSHEFSSVSMLGNDAEASSSQGLIELEQDKMPNGENSSHLNENNITVEEQMQLLAEVEELKASKNEQAYKMETLQNKLLEAQQEIERLERKCLVLESPDDYKLNFSESIVLVGGYDGVTWSSSLSLFSPLADVLISLKPMPSVKPYASVAKLNGEIYVIGGGGIPVWTDTVESYNIENNRWTTRAPLNAKKGYTGGVALNGKIFAIGGGNGADCFSEVEMFDPDIGNWIPARSMQHKRFSVAAVELNGAIYAVGGYDGCEYQKSAERFDPREHSWGRIANMESRRGCHALVAMNEKIYALGGYDGTTMIADTEIYEPRMNKWMCGEAMNQSRGYLAAAVLNDCIYVIGGHKGDEGEGILNMIECYKEGQSWEVTNLRSVGKRCFSPAIVLGSD